MKIDPSIFGFDEILEAAYAQAERAEGIHFVGRADFYVYLDFRVSAGGIFYVGKGTTKRVKLKGRRGKHHANIVRKHRLSRVAFPTASELEALDIEKRLVETIGRLDLGTGPLVNTCDGGEASANFGPEVKARLSANTKAAMADPNVKARHAANIRAALADPAVKARMSESKRGKTFTAEHRARMSESHRGKTLTAEIRARLSANNGMRRPAVKARHAAAMADPAVKAKIAAALADPAVKARHAAAMADPAVRAKIAESTAGQKRIAAELGLKFNEVTKAVIAEYRARNAAA